MGYISAIKKEWKAQQARKAGRNIRVDFIESIPVIQIGEWGFTMECATLSKYPAVRDAVKTVFYKFPEETRHALTFAPKYGAGEWVERVRFWQCELKPVLPDKHYYVAISAILKWFIHCVRARQCVQ